MQTLSCPVCRQQQSCTQVAAQGEVHVLCALRVAALGFGFLDLGITEKSRGRELFHSDACKERDSFIYSSVNTLAG